VSVAVQNIEPFSEIEREIRKLETLLTEKAVEAEILHETLDILRADPMSEPSRCRWVLSERCARHAPIEEACPQTDVVDAGR
jgi:hypothetical protein